MLSLDKSSTADKVRTRRLTRAAWETGAAAITLAAICWFCLQWIPNLDDIQKRQSKVAGLQKEISDLTSQLKSMKSRFVQVRD